MWLRWAAAHWAARKIAGFSRTPAIPSCTCGVTPGPCSSASRPIRDPRPPDPHLTALGGGIEEIEHLLSQREPIYRQTMSAELDVTDLTPDQAVASILQLL